MAKYRLKDRNANFQEEISNLCIAHLRIIPVEWEEFFEEFGFDYDDEDALAEEVLDMLEKLDLKDKYLEKIEEK